MSRTLYAGIDGGGTKTSVVLVDADGNEVAHSRAGTSNPAVIGHELAGQVLVEAVEEARRIAGADATIASAWFGLAGCDRPEDQKLLRPHIDALAGSVRLSNDGELVLGALPRGVGVALVAGTGSIAFGRGPGGERVRAGGWGAVMGDEGSGYALGCALLRAYAAEIDERGPATVMTRQLREQWNLDDPFQAIPRVYSPPLSKGEIADLARIVFDAAAEGDRVAVELVDQAAADLAVLAMTVGRRLGFADSLPVAFTGSLLLSVESLRRRVVDRIATEWPEVRPELVADPALTAARFVAAASRN